ncbi:two-component system response regulator [Butyrivibrio sp. FCS014]|uniref:two-component system response regulator n=2 Tax=Butyrivibrio sp. FCS014 TaxID=1408304 RepID=UPI000463166E|nr:EAL domain-containing response regulator [Butyrivibrio sp. FCS014]
MDRLLEPQNDLIKDDAMTFDGNTRLDIGAKYEKDFRRTVLIVDDEPVNLRILGNILKEEYDIVFAQGGAEALTIIKEQKDFLSLVLLDLYMHDGNGYFVLDGMRDDDSLKNIPVIVITAAKTEEVESLRRGAVDFLGKPYDSPEVIKARVKRAIELSIDRNIIVETGVDSLTGLMTKEFFFQYAREYDKFHPDQQVDAVVLNFCKFHLVNELYGRTMGDNLIRVIAMTAREVARSCGGVACRYNADCFYMYIEHQEDYSLLKDMLVQRISDILSPLDARIRIGVYPDLYRSANLEQRFDRATAASNTISKNIHSPHIAVYDNQMHEKELYEARLLGDMDKALEEHQFMVVFQPKYDITTDTPRLCSAEVLIRWKHPEFGFVRPDSFMPLFEENGRIKELDRYVWREAAKQLKRWKDLYGTAVPISVNVSRVDIYDPDLVDYLKQIIAENNISASELHLEITETAYTDSVTQIKGVVEGLRNEGFMVEMDDFGKGYSSLNMLTSLPIDALKLDMAFITDIAENNKEMSMVEFVLEIARFLGVPVIAEGVESASQYLLLKKAGCDIIQGYYFSKPVSATEFGHLIEKSRMAAR